MKEVLKKYPFLFVFVKKFVYYIKLYLQVLKRRDLYIYKLRIRYNFFELKESGYDYFFGYYDKSPWNLSGDKVLFHKVKSGDTKALVGYYDLTLKKEIILDKVLSWNWQQGCMLQWLDDNTVLFNSFNLYGESILVRYSLDSKETMEYSVPIYALSPDGESYLGLNFQRLEDLKSGYGYMHGKERVELNDSNDGVWLNTFAHDEKHLIFSLDDVKAFEYKSEFQVTNHYVNHLCFSPTNKSFIFIHRWQPEIGDYKSRLLGYNMLTKKFTSLLDNNFVSHFCWMSDTELMIYADDTNKLTSYHVLNVETLKSTPFMTETLRVDGHPTYDSDTSMMITDTYPDSGRLQQLLLVDCKTKEVEEIGEFYSPIKYIGIKRCDLHPRWNNSRDWVCVDTTYSRNRSLCFVNLKDKK